MNIDLLQLKSAKISSVFVAGKEIPASQYNVTGQYLRFIEKPKVKGDVEVLLDISAEKINSEISNRNVAIVVAVIGLIGTIATAVLKPELISQLTGYSPPKNLVVVEPDNYGIDPNGEYFQASIRWDKPTEKNYVFEQSVLDEYKGWYFLRLREDLSDVQLATAENVVGPIEIKNGQLYRTRIPESMKKRFCEGSGALQLIVVGLPKDQALSNGVRIRDLGHNAKILLSPADGRKLSC